MKKVEQSKGRCTSADELCFPTLWYYAVLKFTVDKELPKQSMSILDSPSAHDIETEECEIVQEEFEPEAKLKVSFLLWGFYPELTVFSSVN